MCTACRYSWGQSETEVFVTVSGLPSGTRGADVEFSVSTTSLRLAVHGHLLLSGVLYAAVVADECVFEIETVEAPPATPAPPDEAAAARTGGDGGGNGGSETPPSAAAGGGGRSCILSLTLAKLSSTKAKDHWRCVVHGEPRIDVEAFGEPILAINEDSMDDVQRYLRIMEGAEQGEMPKG